MNIEINEALARKVLDVVDAGLVKGMGVPEPGKMCVEAAVNYAMGAPHGDQPTCVAADPTRANAESAKAAASAASASASAAPASANAASANAASASAASASAAYAAADALDTSLATFCEAVVQILIDMNAPGCQWLWMTEAA